MLPVTIREENVPSTSPTEKWGPKSQSGKGRNSKQGKSVHRMPVEGVFKPIEKNVPMGWPRSHREVCVVKSAVSTTTETAAGQGLGRTPCSIAHLSASSFVLGYPYLPMQASLPVHWELYPLPFFLLSSLPFRMLWDEGGGSDGDNS